VIARRALARALGEQTSSLARADRRGHGPGKSVAVSGTHVVYESAVATYLEARGLEWTGSGVRRIMSAGAITGLIGCALPVGVTARAYMPAEKRWVEITRFDAAHVEFTYLTEDEVIDALVAEGDAEATEWTS
jgi:hypothetical protein